jgi:hypothetical protein
MEPLKSGHERLLIGNKRQKEAQCERMRAARAISWHAMVQRFLAQQKRFNPDQLRTVESVQRPACQVTKSWLSMGTEGEQGNQWSQRRMRGASRKQQEQPDLEEPETF